MTGIMTDHESICIPVLVVASTVVTTVELTDSHAESPESAAVPGYRGESQVQRIEIEINART